MQNLTHQKIWIFKSSYIPGILKCNEAATSIRAMCNHLHILKKKKNVWSDGRMSFDLRILWDWLKKNLERISKRILKNGTEWEGNGKNKTTNEKCKKREMWICVKNGDAGGIGQQWPPAQGRKVELQRLNSSTLLPITWSPRPLC